MKKKTIVIIAIVAVCVLACGTALAVQISSPGVESGQKVGTEIHDSAKALKQQKQGFSMEDDALAIIMGEIITHEYFSYRMDLYEACNYENPAQEAWELMKKEACERKFAEEYNLLPTENEVIEATNQMREVGESTEESHQIAKSLINAMGLSEDEYWNDLKPKYEMTPVLIRENVSVYCEENGLSMPEPSEAEYEVKDTEFFDKLGVEY